MKIDPYLTPDIRKERNVLNVKDKILKLRKKKSKGDCCLDLGIEKDYLRHKALTESGVDEFVY